MKKVICLPLFLLIGLLATAVSPTSTAFADNRCYPAPAGLTNWWPGDGSADDIAGGQNAVLFDNVTFGPGLVDRAFLLDGDGDFVEVPPNPALNFGVDDFSVALWVQFNHTDGEQVLIEKWIQRFSGFSEGWTLTKLEGNVIRLAMSSGEDIDTNVDSRPLRLQPGVWYHFAVTRQGGQVTVFANGRSIATGFSDLDLDSEVPLKFGHRGNPTDTPGSEDESQFYLNGQIDEVQLMVGTALSRRDILGIFNARSAGVCKPAPHMFLRVNYGHEWVESFYEAGHRVHLTVTESDGVTVKATARLFTEPREEWGGEPGFQTRPEDWHPAQPDLQAYDWVFAQVDNGAHSQVQLGEINGAIDLAADSIQGTITAPWLSGELLVECHPWGSPEPIDLINDMVLPDGSDLYGCSWAGIWDIQPNQDVGVGYYEPDSGHWVANAFFVPEAELPHPVIIASIPGDWFWTSQFVPGPLAIAIYESDAEGAALLWQGSRDADESGFVHLFFEDHGQDLVAGNLLVISDGAAEKRLVLETITIEIFDPKNESMAGFAPPGREVVVVAGFAEPETQGIIFTVADPVSGAWFADFKTIRFNVTEAMRVGSFAQIHDEDGDANEAGAPPHP